MKQECQTVRIDLRGTLQVRTLERTIEYVRGSLQLSQAEHITCKNE